MRNNTLRAIQFVPVKDHKTEIWSVQTGVLEGTFRKIADHLYEEEAVRMSVAMRLAANVIIEVAEKEE